MVDVAIFDYGAGNIFSLKTALEKNDANVDIITSFDQSKKYDGLLLPGVGNFDPAIRSIRDYSALGFHDFVKEKIPVLGICLGMEMFFQQSQEGKEKGLDVMNGEVVLLPNDMKIPHMGWNSLEITKDSKILEGVENDSWVYFVHSYRAKRGKFVSIAKAIVSEETSIDMIAGPTELGIIVDSSADPELVANDLVSQEISLQYQ